MCDRKGPSSNHNQAGALGVPKAHPYSILIGEKAHSLLIGGKNCQDTAKVRLLFLLTGDKTEVQTWTKHSTVTSTIKTSRHILLVFE